MNRLRVRGLAWLAKYEHGWPTSKIARYAKVSVRTVQLGIADARNASPGLEQSPRFKLRPLSPVEPLTPESKCPHHGPIRRGSLLCCMVCHQSGMDHHRSMMRSPATTPKPDPRPWDRGKR